MKITHPLYSFAAFCATLAIILLSVNNLELNRQLRTAENALKQATLYLPIDTTKAAKPREFGYSFLGEDGNEVLSIMGIKEGQAVDLRELRIRTPYMPVIGKVDFEWSISLDKTGGSKTEPSFYEWGKQEP